MAQYWGRPRILPGLLMPALPLTKHWLGMPKKESLARLTSWYSSAPVRQRLGQEMWASGLGVFDSCFLDPSYRADVASWFSSAPVNQRLCQAPGNVDLWEFDRVHAGLFCAQERKVRAASSTPDLASTLLGMAAWYSSALVKQYCCQDPGSKTGVKALQPLSGPCVWACQLASSGCCGNLAYNACFCASLGLKVIFQSLKLQSRSKQAGRQEEVSMHSIPLSGRLTKMRSGLAVSGSSKAALAKAYNILRVSDLTIWRCQG